MSSYVSLARFYDPLTDDVPYDAFEAYYRKAFAEDGGEFHLLLDLCCGTGTLTVLLSKAGYDMIGADASPDMLAVAAGKAGEAGVTEAWRAPGLSGCLSLRAGTAEDSEGCPAAW